MTVQLGDQIQVDGTYYLVCGVSATRIALRDEQTGVTREIMPADFARLPDVRLHNSHRSETAPAEIASVQYLPDATRPEILFLVIHLRELSASMEEKMQNNLSARKLILAKRDELATVGYPMSTRTLERKIKTFRERGSRAWSTIGLIKNLVSTGAPIRG